MDILNSNGTVLSVPVNEGSLLHYDLMGQHYVMLVFTTDSPVSFSVGDYIDTDYGVFELLDTKQCSYNTTNGGYEYKIQFEAYYMKWRNKLIKYSPSGSGSEASFSLTSTVSTHMGVLMSNLAALGSRDSSFLYNFTTSFTYSIDSTVVDTSVAKYISYDNTSILDALTAIAEAYECEWWVEGSVIHLGRCESGTEVNFILGGEGENVESMSGSRADQTYATRIYAYGSDRNLPSNYRNSSQHLTVNGVVQRRLMLPASSCPNGYIQLGSVTREIQAVEKVVIFEEVYPKVNCTVGTVTTYESTVRNEDGTTTTSTFYRVTDTSSFNFSNEMILDGETLHIRFETGKLSGMEFECHYSDSEHYYEVVMNSDYGTELPNETLCPQAGDTFVLYGWDATQMTGTNIISQAETRLYGLAQQCLADYSIDPNSYTVIMYSGLPLYGMGRRVKLLNSALFTNGRSSRIIGIELKLDIPDDKPQYTVGENAAYSRSGSLEEQINSLKTSEGLSNNKNTSITRYINNILNGQLSEIQRQVDGKIDTWYYNGVPTAMSYPANEWITDEQKESHEHDWYYDRKGGKAYQWEKVNGVWVWVESTDTQTTALLQSASQSKDAQDGSIRIFVNTPTPPYDIGDLWVNAHYETTQGGETVVVYDNDILKAISYKPVGGTFSINDWTKASNYTDDTYAHGFDYLKAALNETTTVSGGLILSSLIQLGYTDEGQRVTMSGMNGIYVNGKTIAFWAGGEMNDADYPTTGVQSLAKYVMRMDGSGYMAGGNIKWEADGSGSVAGGAIRWDASGNITQFQNTSNTVISQFSSGIQIGSETLLEADVANIRNIGNKVDSSFFAALFSAIDANGNVISVNATTTPVRIRANFDFYSSGEVSAFGVGGSGGGGGGGVTVVDNLTTQNPDYALSANMGYVLNSYISTLSTNLGNYYTKTQSDSRYALQSALATYLPLAGGTMANTNLVTNLNADLIDGYHAADLLSSGGWTTISNANATSGSDRKWYKVDSPTSNNGIVVYDIMCRRLGYPYISYFRLAIFRYNNAATQSVSLINYGINRQSDTQTHLCVAGDAEGNIYIQSGSGTSSNWLSVRTIFGTGTINTTPVGAASFGTADGFTAIKTVINSGYFRTTSATTYDGEPVFLTSSLKASQLSTPRTLWGQSFDGSANVSGNMSDVGSITATGLIQTSDNIKTSTYIEIGSYRLTSTANGLAVTRTDDAEANLYASGEVSAFGVGSSGSGGGLDVEAMWEQLGNNGNERINWTHLSNAVQSNLHAVAFSGSYQDLTDKPTIPAAQVQTDWNATTGMAAILNKPSLNFLPLTGGEVTGNIVPSPTSTRTLGSSSKRWGTVYSVSGNFSGQVTSSVSEGTAPLVIASTTRVANLNADLLDGYEASGLFTALTNSSNEISVSIGGTTRTLEVAYAAATGKAGVSWQAIYTQSEWSKVLKISGYTAVLFSIRMNQSGQSANATFIINTSYQAAQCTMINAGGYNSNSAFDIRITRSASTTFDVEISSSYMSGSVTTATAYCHALNIHNTGALTPYTAYTAGSGTVTAAAYTANLVHSFIGRRLKLTQGSTSGTPDLTVAGLSQFGGAMTVSGLLTADGSVKSASYVDIGNFRIIDDTTNGALKIMRTDGTSANMYATGDVIAYGIDGSSGGGGSATLDDMWTSLTENTGTYANRQINSGHLSAALSAYATRDWVTSQISGFTANAVTDVTVSGNNLVVSKGSSSTNLTIPYATLADTATNASKASYADAVRDPVYYTSSSRRTSANTTFNHDGALHYYPVTNGMTTAKPKENGFILQCSFDTGNYDTQLFVGRTTLGYRYQSNVADWTGRDWIYVLDDNNFKSKIEGVSGTFAISISGNAATATSAVSTGKWATAREFKIYDSDSTNYGAATSVDGSSAVSLYLPATIKASLSGNATSATTLQTQRRINGTYFDGSADITTSKWGTSRTITLSSGTHSYQNTNIDGSANFTLTLPSTLTATLEGNASTATKLASAVSLWGNSFDGSSSISGAISISGTNAINLNSKNALYQSGNTLYVGSGFTGSGNATRVIGATVSIYVGNSAVASANSTGFHIWDDTEVDGGLEVTGTSTLEDVVANGLITANEALYVPTGQYIRVGDAYLWYNATAGCLMCTGANGTYAVMNFSASGEVSAMQTS